jgi:hypothetical protein
MSVTQKASFSLTLSDAKEIEMPQTALKDFDKKLEQYQELGLRRAQLEKMLHKAREEKGSVNQDIYERVFTDYQKALDDVIKAIDPLHAEIEQLRNKWNGEIQDIDAKVLECTERLQEIEFRGRVGEYDEQEQKTLSKPIQEQLSTYEETRNEIEGKLAQIEASGNGVSSSGKPASSRDTTKETSASQTKNPSTKRAVPDEEGETDTIAEEAGKVFDSDGLIDLTNWTKEFQSDQNNPQKRRATDKTDADTDDVSGQTGDTESADASARPDAASEATDKPLGGFPVLIITQGPGSGKKLPLVPITMTLGREHDNNIELKDEEVARYHARISFQAGEYILADLESSSGTWVNDEKITEVALRHGDKVKVGSTEMIVDFD